MRSLFDGITATGQDAWGLPKQGLPTNGVEKDSSSAHSVTENPEQHIDLDPQSPPKALFTRKKKQRKKNDGDVDEKLLAVLKTLEQSRFIEECNKKLDEMGTL